jgi:hypothetical protein
MGSDGGIEDFSALVWWVTVGVNEKILRAVVGALEFGSTGHGDHTTCGNIHTLRRLSEIDRQVSGKDDECFILFGVAVAFAVRSRFVSPNIRSHVVSVKSVAQFGDVTRGLVGFVRARLPLQVGRDDHSERHRASLVIADRR